MNECGVALGAAGLSRETKRAPNALSSLNARTSATTMNTILAYTISHVVLSLHPHTPDEQYAGVIRVI